MSLAFLPLRREKQKIPISCQFLRKGTEKQILYSFGKDKVCVFLHKVYVWGQVVCIHQAYQKLKLFWHLLVSSTPPKKCSLARLSKYEKHGELFMLWFRLKMLAWICTSYTADFHFVLGCILDPCEVCLGLPCGSAIFPARWSCHHVCLMCANQLHLV